MQNQQSVYCIHSFTSFLSLPSFYFRYLFFFFLPVFLLFSLATGALVDAGASCSHATARLSESASDRAGYTEQQRTDRETESVTPRTDRQTGAKTERQTDRQADGTERHKNRLMDEQTICFL